MPKFIRLTKKGRMIKKRSYKRKMGMRKSRKNVGGGDITNGSGIKCTSDKECLTNLKCIQGICKPYRINNN